MKKILSAIMIFNILCIAAMSCFFLSGKDFSQAQNESRHIIGACYADFGSEYCSALNSIILPAVNERGDIFLYRDADDSQDFQNKQIKELITAGCRLLIIVPVNDTVDEALRYAKEMGVFTILLDTKARRHDLADISIISDDYVNGEHLATYLLMRKSSANILLLSDDDSLSGFADTIKNAGKTDFNIISTAYLKKEPDESITALIRRAKDFDTILACSSEQAYLACAYFPQKSILSIGGSPGEKMRIANGRLLATVTRFPSVIGEAAVKGAYDILNNRHYETSIIVPGKLITADTIGSYDPEKWE